MAPPSERRCALCALQGTGLFCSLDRTGRDRLDREKTLHRYRRGQGLFYAGTPAMALYVIRTGKVKVVRLAPDGGQLLLRILGPGEILGYRGLFADEPYAASAEALEDTEVCILPRPVVTDLLRRSPELALELLQKISREMRISEDTLLEISRQPVLQRVARLLLTLADSPRRDASVLPGLRRTDMAAMIGTSPETLSRALQKLARRGAIVVTRREIRLRDVAVLRRIARSGPPTESPLRS